MGIGVLDARPNGRWVTTVGRMTKATGAFRFQSHGVPLRIALFNSNVTPSVTTATIRKLTVYAIP